MVIRKRDGRLVDFEPDKILDSIKKAALAVELKDEDVQKRSQEIQNLKHQLIQHGFDAEDAEEQAEMQFDGYIENGEYTEYDEDEAEEVLDIVLDSIDSLELDEDDVLETSMIQDFVEKALMVTNHNKTAKEYIIKRANRERIREMNTSLMKSFEDLTFGKSKDVETKRENANIDGDSSMGTMLKYGSEGAKKFNLLYVVPPDESEAHSNGDIHIHDLDFYSLTETCITGDTLLTIRNAKTGEVKVITAESFDSILGDKPDNTVVNIDGYEILSGNEFVKLINCVRHPSDKKTVLDIKTKTGNVKVTSEHVIPVIVDEDSAEIDKRASDLKIGYKLLHSNLCGTCSLKSIDLIELFGASHNIIIHNTQYVIDSIKSTGNWKQFCKLIGYTGRGSSIRNGTSKLTLADYYAYVIPLGINIDHKELQLAYRRTRGNETINAIVPLTRELGKFIGYMISEGSITCHISKEQDSPVKKACFTNSNELFIEDFNNAVAKVFNNVAIRDRVVDGVRYGTHLSGYLTYELFHGPLGTKNCAGDIQLPDWIYSANKEFLSGFLGAMIDGDGMVQADGYRVQYTTACENLAKELQKLLLLNGIESFITKTSNKGTIAIFGEKESIRKYDTYYLSITNDSCRLSFIDSFKIEEKLIEKESRKSDKSNITGIEVIDYNGYVYDFETENHYFNANGFKVHNCNQINLEKLFKDGFNTGHGFLREPGEIRSYAALACIAIQSNQNDMHKSVA